jgi:DNA-binding FadR family transcriptional regulator
MSRGTRPEPQLATPLATSDDGASEAGAPARRRQVAPDVDARSVVFRPVRTGNAFEETVERLLSAVKLGLVGPGDRLPPERELAARLEVSRMTLREAIRALQQAGFVSSRRGRHGGTFVLARERDPDVLATARAGSTDEHELADALAMRQVVEVGAAGLAAARVAASGGAGCGAERLGRILEECRGAESASYRRADSRLHVAIAELSASPSVVAAVADARIRVNDLLDRIPLLQANITHSDEQHELVVGAVLDGDAEAARAAMDDHLAGTAALLRAFLT